MSIQKNNRRNIHWNPIRVLVSILIQGPSPSQLLCIIPSHDTDTDTYLSLPCLQPHFWRSSMLKRKQEQWLLVRWSCGIQDCDVTISLHQILPLLLLLLFLFLILFSISPISSNPLPSSHPYLPPLPPPLPISHRLFTYAMRMSTTTAKMFSMMQMTTTSKNKSNRMKRTINNMTTAPPISASDHQNIVV